VTSEQSRREFEALFEAHRVAIASYCSWRAGSVSDAEDAVAEVFLVAWRRFHDIPTGDSARAWLYATARGVLANQRRSGRRRDALRQRLTLEREAVAHGPAATSAAEVAVHEALQRLADDEREVLLLVEWEGLDSAELAEVLGCRPVTARGRLHRARRRFRDLYQPVADQHAQPSDHPQALLAREGYS
jgi:RNA polymerase sigma-70 factor (ECF subfamily)